MGGDIAPMFLKQKESLKSSVPISIHIQLFWVLWPDYNVVFCFEHVGAFIWGCLSTIMWCFHAVTVLYHFFSLGIKGVKFLHDAWVNDLLTGCVFELEIYTSISHFNMTCQVYITNGLYLPCVIIYDVILFYTKCGSWVHVSCESTSCLWEFMLYKPN